MALTITSDNLARYARQHMRPMPTAPFAQTLVQASDPKMELPTAKMFAEIVELLRPRMPEGEEYSQDGRFDCDDYTFIFKGLVCDWYRAERRRDLPLALGLGWGRFTGFGQNLYHALNWVILADDEKLYWVEPQDLRDKPLDDTMRRYSKRGDRVNLLMV